MLHKIAPRAAISGLRLGGQGALYQLRPVDFKLLVFSGAWDMSTPKSEIRLDIFHATGTDVLSVMAFLMPRRDFQSRSLAG